ncbi:MAG: Gfo/Idh/MocA family oxidoreductase [Janthinobacterium lividum]
MHPAPAPLPTAITSKRREAPERTTYLVVGTGWRAEPYLRLAAMLPDRFGVTGIVAHSQASQERAGRDWGVEVHADLDAALAAGRPDFVVLSVPWPVTPVLVRRLVELDLPVLTETPPAPDLDGLHALWADVGAAGLVQVAEQYALMPLDAARLALVAEGVIGTTSSVVVSSTHLYHAVAMMRSYLRVGADEPVEVVGRSYGSTLVDPLTPAGWTYDDSRKPVQNILAALDFGQGRLGRYDFTDNQWWNPLRPDHLLVRGSAGEIADTTVVHLADATTPLTSRLERVSTGTGMDYQGLDLTHVTFEGRVVWRNDFQGARLTDDDLGVAVLLDRMGAWVREGGAGPYPLRDACQDHAVGMAIEEAVATGETVRVERQPWA